MGKLKKYFPERYFLTILVFCLLVTLDTNGQDNCALAELLYNQEEKTTKQGSPQSQRLLDSAIQLCPNYSTAYMEKSVAYNKCGDFQTGFYWLNKAVAMDPEKHLGYRGWLRLRKLRDFEGAIQDFKKLQTLVPNIGYVWGEHIDYLLGEAKLGLNELDSAAYYYSKGVFSETKLKGKTNVDPYAHMYLGLCFYKKHDYAKALQSFNEALSLYRQCTEALYYKALVLLVMNKNKGALGVMENAKYCFEKGYSHRDKYNEYLYQLYYSDIIEGLDKIISSRK